MPSKKSPEPPRLEPRVFRSADEIDWAIEKLQRRIDDLSALDVPKAHAEDTGQITTLESDIRATIREVFGEKSPEFHEDQHLQIWLGPLGFGMGDEDILGNREKGKVAVKRKLDSLIARLKEKRDDLEGGPAPTPESSFTKLNLHPRLTEVATDLFLDGHYWDAVFAASKALVNYVKDRSGSDLDGAPPMRTVFSPKKPILAFNDLTDQTEQDEQEGIMHLFEGAALAIRNPSGHAFPDGSPQRALEYISFLSMLANLVREAKKRVAS